MDEEEESTWAVVETHKGIGEVFSYRGQIRREQLERWLDGDLHGAISLHNAYWLEQRGDRIVPFVVGRSGDYRNARGVLHVAADTVSIIMELESPDPGVLDAIAGAPVLTLARPLSTGQRKEAPKPPRPPKDMSTESPSTESPSTESPSTESPSTESPSTESASTESEPVEPTPNPSPLHLAPKETGGDSPDTSEDE